MKINPSFDEITNYLMNSKDKTSPLNIDFQKISLVDYVSKIDFKSIINERTINYLKLVDNLTDLSSNCFAKSLDKTPIKKLRELRVDYLKKVDNEAYSKEAVKKEFSEGFRDFFEKRILDDILTLDSNGLPTGLGESIDENAIESMGDFYIKNFKEIKIDNEFRDYLISIRPLIGNTLIDQLISKGSAARHEVVMLEELFVKQLISNFVPIKDYSDKDKLIDDFNITAKNVSNNIKSLKGEVHESMYKFSGVQLGSDNPVLITLKKLADSQGFNGDWHMTLTNYFLINELKNQFNVINELEPEITELSLRSARRTKDIIESAFKPFLDDIITISKNGAPVLFSNEDVYSNFDEEYLLNKFNESWSRLITSKGRKEVSEGKFVWDESKLKDSDKGDLIKKEFLGVIKTLADDLANDYKIALEPEVLWLENNLEGGLINNSGFSFFILNKLMQITGKDYSIDSLTFQKDLIKKVNSFYNKKFSEIKIEDEELNELLKNNDQIKERVIDFLVNDKNRMSKIIERIYLMGDNAIVRASDSILNNLKKKNSDEIIDYLISLNLLDDESINLLKKEKSIPITDYQTLESKINLSGIIADSLNDHLINLNIKSSNDDLNVLLNNELNDYVINLVTKDPLLLSATIDAFYEKKDNALNRIIKMVVESWKLTDKNSNEIIELLKDANVITNEALLRLENYTKEGVTDYNTFDKNENIIGLVSDSLKEQLKNGFKIVNLDAGLNELFNDCLSSVEVKDELLNTIKNNDTIKTIVYEGLIKNNFSSQLKESVLNQIKDKNSDEVIDYLLNADIIRPDLSDLISKEKSKKHYDFSKLCFDTKLLGRVSDSIKDLLKENIKLVTNNKEVDELLDELNKELRQEVYTQGGVASLSSLLKKSEFSFDWVEKTSDIDKETKSILFEEGVKKIITKLSGSEADYNNVIYGLRILNNQRYYHDNNNEENINRITDLSQVIKNIQQKKALDNDDLKVIVNMPDIVKIIYNYIDRLNYNFMKGITKKSNLQVKGDTQNTFYHSLLNGLNNFFGNYQEKLISTITDLVSVSNDLKNDDSKSVHELLKEKIKTDDFLGLLVNNDSFNSYIGKALKQIIEKKNQLIGDKNKLRSLIKSFNKMTNQSLVMDLISKSRDKNELAELSKNQGLDYIELMEAVDLIEESFDLLDNNKISPYEFRSNIRRKFNDLNDIEFQAKFERIVEREYFNEKERLAENDEKLLEHVKSNFADVDNSVKNLRGITEKNKLTKEILLNTLRNKFSELSSQITEEKLKQPSKKLYSLKLSNLESSQLEDVLSKNTTIINSIKNVKFKDLGNEIKNYFVTDNLNHKDKNSFNKSIDELNEHVINYQNKTFEELIDSALKKTGKKIDKKIVDEFLKEVGFDYINKNKFLFMNLSNSRNINNDAKNSISNVKELINELTNQLITDSSILNEPKNNKELLTENLKMLYDSLSIKELTLSDLEVNLSSPDKSSTSLSEHIRNSVIKSIIESLKGSLKCFEIPFSSLKDSDNFLKGIIKDSSLVNNKGINEFIMGLFGKPYDSWYEALTELKNDRIALAEDFIRNHEHYKTREISELFGKIKILNGLNDEYSAELNNIEKNNSHNKELVAIKDNKDHELFKPINQSKIRLTKLESLSDNSLRTNISRKSKRPVEIDIKKLLDDYKMIKGLWH